MKTARVLDHTPLPWETFRRRDDFPEREIHSADSVIAIVLSGSDNHLPVEANAAFIVRACNSHYRLLSALKGLLAFLPDRADALDYAAGNDGRVGKIHVAVSKAYQAIFAAERELDCSNLDAKELDCLQRGLPYAQQCRSCRAYAASEKRANRQ